MIQIKKNWSSASPYTFPTCRGGLVFVLVGSRVGVVFLLSSNSVSLSSPHRWPKAIGSGVVSQSRWTVPFSQASMGCGICTSLLWCSCTHHPIRTMGMTSLMVSARLFSVILFRVSRLLSLQDLRLAKALGFPNFLLRVWVSTLRIVEP